MRFSVLVAVSALALSLGACSSDSDLDPYGDELFPNEQADTSGYDSGQAVPSVPVDGYDQSSLGYGSAAAGSQEDLAVNVGDRVFFAYDSYNLSPEATRQLELQSQWLRQYPSVNVLIGGHADERGTREYNLALGDKRATAVKNYLVSLGVSPSRIQTISYGKERPEMLGSGTESWAKNRRAVTNVQ